MKPWSPSGPLEETWFAAATPQEGPSNRSIFRLRPPSSPNHHTPQICGAIPRAFLRVFTRRVNKFLQNSTNEQTKRSHRNLSANKLLINTKRQQKSKQSHYRVNYISAWVSIKHLPSSHEVIVWLHTSKKQNHRRLTIEALNISNHN